MFQQERPRVIPTKKKTTKKTKTPINGNLIKSIGPMRHSNQNKGDYIQPWKGIIILLESL